MGWHKHRSSPTRSSLGRGCPSHSRHGGWSLPTNHPIKCICIRETAMDEGRGGRKPEWGVGRRGEGENLPHARLQKRRRIFEIYYGNNWLFSGLDALSSGLHGRSAGNFLRAAVGPRKSEADTRGDPMENMGKYGKLRCGF